MTFSLIQRMALIIILASAAFEVLAAGNNLQAAVYRFENVREFNLNFKNVNQNKDPIKPGDIGDNFNREINNLINEMNDIKHKIAKGRKDFDINNFHEEKVVENIVKEVKYNGRPSNNHGDKGYVNQRVIRREWVNGKLVVDEVQEGLQDPKQPAKNPVDEIGARKNLIFGNKEVVDQKKNGLDINVNNYKNAYDKYFNPIEKELLGDAYKFLPKNNDRAPEGVMNNRNPDRRSPEQRNDEKARIFRGYEEKKFKEPAKDIAQPIKGEIIKANGERNVGEYKNNPAVPVVNKEVPKYENPAVKPLAKDLPVNPEKNKIDEINDIYAYINKNRAEKGMQPIDPYLPETKPPGAEKKIVPDVGVDKKQDPRKVVQNVPAYQGNKDAGAGPKPNNNIVIDAKVKDNKPSVQPAVIKKDDLVLPANADYKDYKVNPVLKKDPEVQQVKKVNQPENLALKKNAIATPAEVIPKKIEANVKNILPEFKPSEVFKGGELEPLEIVWEIGAVKRILEDSNMKEKYTYFKELMKKATAIIRMYVAIPKSERQIISISEGKQCERYFKESMRFNTHLVMLADVFAPKNKEEEQVIAQASPCHRTPTERTDIGIISFNGYKLIGENSTNTEKFNFLMTVVHETLHALAFHADADRLLIKKEVAGYLENLNKIKSYDPNIYDKGHWDDQYIPNDVMVKTSKRNSIITIYTLEMLAHRSPSYKVNYGGLIHNSFTSNIIDMDKFFNYKCSDSTEKSEYSQFCSPKEAAQNVWGCSPDYIYQTNCGNRKLKNGCFSKDVDKRFNCMDPLMTNEVFSNTRKWEFRGAEGRCFQDSKKSALCLKSNVIGNDVIFFLGSQQYKCKTSGEIIKAEIYVDATHYVEVEIKCPDLDSFKDSFRKTSCPESCNSNGFCSLGKCICYDGYDSKTNCKTKTHYHYDTLMFSEVMRDK